MKTICCVLRSGGDFVPAHVEWLRRQCARHMPAWDFFCWSDMDVPISFRLKTTWPRWWAKMEIYGSPVTGPSLIVDLDTVFLKPFEILPEHEHKALIMRDPWKNGQRFPERLGGGFMYLPQWAKAHIWENWIKDPEKVMGECGDNDQVFLHKLFKDKALRIQDHYVDQLASYKVHVQSMGLQEDNRVVYFHGQPRPWNVDEPWIPKLET